MKRKLLKRYRGENSVNNEKREKTELEEKIYNDVQTEIWKYYDSENIEYKDKEDPQDTIIDFFSYLYRLIAPTRRKVHYSEELSKKITLNEISTECVEILKKYEDAFSEGKDMNVFLSNKIKKLRETDFLLYTWHLYHLHMSGKFVEDANQMKNNRSDTQLLCIVNSSDVYFVDVISHPTRAEEYFNIRSLEIIVNNDWMEKIGFCEMTDMIAGTLEPKVTQDKDIFELYSKCGVNISFEFQKKAYCSLEPMNHSRRPYVAVKEIIKINKAICKLNSVEGTYKSFQLGCDDEGKLLGIAEFEFATGEKKFLNIF
jgi:hypothetical protein